ncbi:xanthine dehydrogenase family protein molybdopterin-binding subunit [Ectothiorhodospiraceae bacterium WFHF3C12]|nr:xanthine dehydrogenase family protein molybdopterin-binding subunit [Ectothiorhodospiraceae bacterium WFHF3C12]
MSKFGVGQPARRSEDQRFLTGQGRYLADIKRPGELYGYVVRSPHAHADIGGIDCTEARQAPGVQAVYTVEDLRQAGIGDIPCMADAPSPDGTPAVKPPRPALADGRVRHVGDPVAFVVADTPARARDAGELVMVDYDDRPAVTDTAGAAEAEAAQVWPEAPGNQCFHWELGDAQAVERAFDEARHVVEVELVNNRVVPNSMETRGAIGEVEAESGRLVLYVSSQGAHLIRNILSKHVLDMPNERLHVITPDVGGGFGMKIFLYPEYVLVLHAARELGRPVKWIGERSEAFVGDAHGRDHVSRAELALDADARFLGMRVHTTANLGAYLSNFGTFVPTAAGARVLPGCYRLPAVHNTVRGVFTNTNPVDAYRGAGRPEAMYLVERLVDKAARQLGLSPVEIRRRNLVTAEEMPYANAMGLTYDTGDFHRNMADALAAADWEGFEARRGAAKERGMLRGIGLCTYIESCAGGSPESARITVTGDGEVVVYSGTQSNGQGHETAYRQLVSEYLGVDMERIRVVQGDTDRVASGGGTMGSRSIPVGGSAVRRSADRVVDAAMETAARELEAAATDVEFDAGEFRIAGTDRAISFQAVAQAAAGEGGGTAFDETDTWAPEVPTFPNGCHICEVEVDPQTGVVAVERYTVVDDFGTVLNPLLLEGQVHGGIAQGLGQALWEQCAFDPESGQLVSGSFMDYAMPRADQMPPIDFHLNNVPSTTNALGMKGAGEAGAIAAPPAVINALVDALSDYGVEHVDMPATPERLWRMVHGA